MVPVDVFRVSPSANIDQCHGDIVSARLLGRMLHNTCDLQRRHGGIGISHSSFEMCDLQPHMYGVPIFGPLAVLDFPC